MRTPERAAVHVAAVVMQAAGLCRYDDLNKCRKVWPPADGDCVACIEKWLLAMGRKETRDNE